MALVRPKSAIEPSRFWIVPVGINTSSTGKKAYRINAQPRASDGGDNHR
jgi:hypothetical protein